MIPLVPGFTLLLALLFGRSAWFLHVGEQLGLTGFEKTAVLICAAYACGFMLHFISLGIAGLLTSVALPFVLRLAHQKWNRPTLRNNLGSSRGATWRVVATLFLGDLVPPPTLQGTKWDDKIDAYDGVWQEWYNVLQEYLWKDQPIIPPEVWATLGGLQASGWAVLISGVYVPVLSHWVAAIPAILAIFLAIALPIIAVFNYYKFDRANYWVYTAKLLAEIHERQKLQPRVDFHKKGI